MPQLNPKAQFQKGSLAKAHVDLVVQDGFLTTLNTTLAHMELCQGTAPDMGSAAAAHWKMVGAREFISHLLNLAEPGEQKREGPKQNLRHDI